MKKKLFYSILLLLAFVLELLPYGAVFRVADYEGESKRILLSYFDLLPYGYGNVGPFLTAILTVMLLLLTAYLWLRKKPLGIPSIVLTALAVSTAAFPFYIGIEFTSPVGWCITAALIAAICISFTKEKTHQSRQE